MLIGVGVRAWVCVGVGWGVGVCEGRGGSLWGSLWNAVFMYTGMSLFSKDHFENVSVRVCVCVYCECVYFSFTPIMSAGMFVCLVTANAH